MQYIKKSPLEAVGQDGLACQVEPVHLTFVKEWHTERGGKADCLLQMSRSKFKTSGKVLYQLRGMYQICLESVKESRKITPRNQLDLETTRILTDYAQK